MTVGSRRPITEKIAAVTLAYRALAESLGRRVTPEVDAALIHAATVIAMGSDTKEIATLGTLMEDPSVADD